MLVNTTLRAVVKFGSVKVFNADKECVATFDGTASFKTLTGANSIDEFNARPATFKFVKREC